MRVYHLVQEFLYWASTCEVPSPWSRVVSCFRISPSSWPMLWLLVSHTVLERIYFTSGSRCREIVVFSLSLFLPHPSSLFSFSPLSFSCLLSLFLLTPSLPPHLSLLLLTPPVSSSPPVCLAWWHSISPSVWWRSKHGPHHSHPWPSKVPWCPRRRGITSLVPRLFLRRNRPGYDILYVFFCHPSAVWWWT